MRGGIQSLQGLLARYTALRAPQGAVIEVFITSVQDVCGVGIQKTVVTYKPHTKTIGLSFAGPRKTEILLHKKAILEHCRRSLGDKNAPTNIV